MKAKIEHPKVFISYAWGDKLNQQKVLSFASDLIKNGIDVLLDRWDLKEGNDKYSYMEKSVTDETVTNVLLLLDENYTNKANSRTGGVGDETQIISPEIYGKVEQSKFLPIIFTKGTNGEVYKPAYLQSTLHIDLSESDTYDENFMYLVKLLYGVEIYKKPELGTKPAFVEDENFVPVKTTTKFQSIKKQNAPLAQKNALQKAFKDLSIDISSFETKFSCDQTSFLSAYLKKYQDTQIFLKELQELMEISLVVNDSKKIVGDFYENLYNHCSLKQDKYSEIRMILIHEMFITSIAILLKYKDYYSAGYLLGRTYFFNSPYQSSPDANSFTQFYCCDFQNIDAAVNLRDNKKYYTGEGYLWLERVSPEHCSKNEFALADILCYNYTLFKKDPFGLSCSWFPLTYFYGFSYENNVLAVFSAYLKSKERLTEILPLFSMTEHDFVLKIKELEELNKQGKFAGTRYPTLFRAAPVICQFVKSEEIGKYR